jgi:hypothetical protein
VFDLIVLAGLAFAAFICIGVLISVFTVAGWFLWLPFKIIGWALRGIGLLIALPFILLACLLGGFGILLGAGVLVLPLVPLAMVGALLWWIFHRRSPTPTQARVV